MEDGLAGNLGLRWELQFKNRFILEQFYLSSERVQHVGFGGET